MQVVEGNLETSHLLEQIESLRGAVRFLRTENGYLKGHDMLRDLQALLPLHMPSSSGFYVPSPTPPLVADDGSDDDTPAATDPAEVRRQKIARLSQIIKKPINGATPTIPEADTSEQSKTGSKKTQSLRALSTESKVLYRELLAYSASPRLVDLEALENEKKKGGWIPQRKTAAHQIWERKKEGERLGRKVKGLMERVDGYGAAHPRAGLLLSR